VRDYTKTIWLMLGVINLIKHKLYCRTIYKLLVVVYYYWSF